jgi:hypothetical protein
MTEIGRILLHYDIAGYVLLCEPGFSEWLIHVNPSWSMMAFESCGPVAAIRFRSKSEDFGGDTEAQRVAIERTANMTEHFRALLFRDAAAFKELSEVLATIYDITHYQEPPERTLQ